MSRNRNLKDLNNLRTFLSLDSLQCLIKCRLTMLTQVGFSEVFFFVQFEKKTPTNVVKGCFLVSFQALDYEVLIRCEIRPVAEKDPR